MNFVQKLFLFTLVCFVGTSSASKAADDKPLSVQEALTILKLGKKVPDFDSVRAITWAGRTDHEQLISAFIQHPVYKSDINKHDKICGISALGHAAIHGNCRAVTLLIDGGADVYDRDRLNLTPFMRAAFNGQVAILRLMYHKASDKKKIVGTTMRKSSITFNALCLAAEGISPDTVSFLLKVKSPLVEQALDIACEVSKDMDLFRKIYPKHSIDYVKKANAEIQLLLKNNLHKQHAQDSLQSTLIALELDRQLAVEEQKKLSSKPAHMKKKKTEAEKRRIRALKQAHSESVEKQKKDEQQLLRQQEMEKALALRRQKKAEDDANYDQQLHMLREHMKAEAIKKEQRSKALDKIERIAHKQTMRQALFLLTDVAHQKVIAQQLVNRFAPRRQLGGSYTLF